MNRDKESNQIAEEAWKQIRFIKSAIEKATVGNELRQETLALEQMASRFNKDLLKSRVAIEKRIIAERRAAKK